MKLKIEDFDELQEITIEGLKLYGHFDENLFCQMLIWCGLRVRSGSFGFEVTIEKKLAQWQAARIIELLRRYNFSDVDLGRIEGLEKVMNHKI